MKILVIDDEKPTLSMFKLFLAAYGYEVFTAEDGETGLRRFREICPEIVFTDIRMPGIDGLEVLRRIRKLSPPTQVIIITGHGDMEKAVEALDLDASDFINKPVERQALNSALARAEKRAGMAVIPEFTCNHILNQGRKEIHIKGKLTADHRQRMADLICSEGLQTSSQAHFLFDDSFSIDRGGIKLLMEILIKIRQRRIQVIMTGLSYNYVRFFQMAGMDKLAQFQTASSDKGEG